MAKTCDFKTSEASTKAWMRKRNLLTSFLEIPESNLTHFRQQNSYWSKKAFQRHHQAGIKPGDMLFYEEPGAKKVIPNTEMFHRIDADKGNFYQENLKYVNDIKTTSNISTNIKAGVTELFESNPELANAVYEALGFITKSKIETTNTPAEIRKELFEKQERGQISLAGEDIDIISQSRNNPTEENIQELRKLYNDLIGDLQDSIVNEITPQQKQQALQLYSQYLDTIFPDSKVKDIVYHGTKGDKFDKFKSSGTGTFGKGVYFGDYKTALQNTDLLDDFTLEPIKGFDKDKIIPALINTQNIFQRDLGGNGIRNEYVVEPEQIHILGSKQDIKGFKKFANNTSKELSDKFVDDLYNLNLTPEVITYLYNENGSTHKLLDYGFMLKEMVNSLKSQNRSFVQILDDIKCL